MIHQIRNSLKCIPWNKHKEFVKELKLVYRVSSLEIPQHQLDLLEQKWGKKYPVVFKSWRTNWDRLTQYFKYPEPVRRLIYTTNTVGYHRMVPKVTKSKGAFTSDTAMLKLVYLATLNFSETMEISIHNWPTVLNSLAIYFEDRINNDTV